MSPAETAQAFGVLSYAVPTMMLVAACLFLWARRRN
jgi:EamA domain-containing membrane protein RarD